MPLKKKGQGSTIQSSQPRDTLAKTTFMNDLAVANGHKKPGPGDTNGKNQPNITKEANVAGAQAARTGNL